jgi:hypothetical protein
MTEARSGIGTTLTFGTSGFSAKVRNYNDIGMSREILDATHMGSPAGATFTGLIFRETRPGDLGTTKELSIDILFDPDDNDIPIDQPAEEITMQFKALSTQSTGAQWIFDGFVSDWSASVPYDGLMTGTLTISVSGEPTWNAGVAI